MNPVKHYKCFIATCTLILGLVSLAGISAEPARTGFDRGALETIRKNAGDPSLNLHSLLIERDGQVVLEIYRPGGDATLNSLNGLGSVCSSTQEFDANRLHDVRSVSKSIVSLLWGIPEYQKLLPALETPVLSLYPELADLTPDSSRAPNRGAGKATESDLSAFRDRITVEHLFTMSSGLDWEEWTNPLFSDEIRLLWTHSHARFLFDRGLVLKPGEKFKYNGGGTAVLADILVKATGKTLIELAREKLLLPLEIRDFEWAQDFRDRPMPHAGLRLRPRDMVKIGRLVLNGGVWNGKQIVRRDWIEISTRKHLDTGVTLLSWNGQSIGYGYQWWTGSSFVKGKQIDWTAAVGNGGQRIFVVPSLDLVVVTTAGDYGKLPIQMQVGRLFERVLGAIR